MYMIKKSKESPKALAKITLMEAIKNNMPEEFTLVDDEELAMEMSTTTFVVSVAGVDVKVSLTVPKGGVDNLRYERVEKENEI